MKIIDQLRNLVGITTIEVEDEELIEAIPVENEKQEPMLKQVKAEDRTHLPASCIKGTPNGFDVQPERMAIEIFSPLNINDCSRMADKFKEGYPVIISFEYTNTEDARQILFFMKGCCYALDGLYQKIGNNILMLTPKNVPVSNSKGKSLTEDTFSFSWRSN